MTTLAVMDPSRIQRLEQCLALRAGFLAELETGDDWSYVVRTHTLIESALTERLLSAIGRTELDAVLHGLELGTHHRGKLAFVRALRLLGDADIRFIRFFDELRSSLLRSSRASSVTFSGYFEPRSDLQLQQLYCSWGIPRLGGEDGARLRRAFRDKPRLFIHFMALGLLERIHADQGKAEPIEEQALLALLRHLDETGV
jgi:hypothetical protein